VAQGRFLAVSDGSFLHREEVWLSTVRRIIYLMFFSSSFHLRLSCFVVAVFQTAVVVLLWRFCVACGGTASDDAWRRVIESGPAFSLFRSCVILERVLCVKDLWWRRYYLSSASVFCAFAFCFLPLDVILLEQRFVLLRRIPASVRHPCQSPLQSSLSIELVFVE